MSPKVSSMRMVARKPREAFAALMMNAPVSTAVVGKAGAEKPCTDIPLVPRRIRDQSMPRW